MRIRLDNGNVKMKVMTNIKRIEDFIEIENYKGEDLIEDLE